MVEGKMSDAGGPCMVMVLSKCIRRSGSPADAELEIAGVRPKRLPPWMESLGLPSGGLEKCDSGS